MVPYMIEKSINKFNRLVFGKRILSSLPFLSGDTYRLACDVDISDLRFGYLIDLDVESSVVVFSPISQVPQLIAWLRENPSIRSTKWKLVLHNGDNILNEYEALTLLHTFFEIYSVNWLAINERVFPIPIGLENYRYFLNGDITKFPHKVSVSNESWQSRPYDFLVSFKIANNPLLRSEIREHLSFSDNVYTPGNFLNPKEYRKSLAKSRFVISPPGNGIDCHRTWESLYFGAVPIVLRDFWAFGSELPVLPVQKWSDIQSCYCDFVPSPVENIAELIKMKYFNF